MSDLITLDKIKLAYGTSTLLNDVKLQIRPGERVCLIGRNGTGKSSLLKIIEGSLLPDEGVVWRKPHLRLSRLEQDYIPNAPFTVYEFVAKGLAAVGELLAAYHSQTLRLAHSHSEKDLSELTRLQHEIEAKNGWLYEQNINSILSQLGLDPEQKIAELSGGWQRRVLLAKALVSSPELLLLDEPTNHLDINAIQWLENQLLGANYGLLFITHDRELLKRLATRIIELDRGELTSWPGDYANFLRRKEEMLLAEEHQNAVFDKKLAQEERWIRQGIKARRTRNEGRVRALKALRRERAERQELIGKATFNLNEAHKSGKIVIEAEAISHRFNNQTIIKDFSMRILRGDRIGLIGPNGVGKSTLLNILLQNIQPQKGKVTLGTKLKIAYFDQLRQVLDLEKTVVENVAQGSDMIEINGVKRHVISYLNDFLFTPERARTPVKALSGGECNRLVLARLFSQPANLLVLDEPTNDLDIETLELLEELINQFQGTLLIVSHDRAFLDNVVTSTLVFEGEGRIEEYVGGYQDWLRQKKPEQLNQPISNTAKTTIEKSKPHKLTYKEQKELISLPVKIQSLEEEQSKLQEETIQPEFYQQSPEIINLTMEKLKKLDADLTNAYLRWEELEKISDKK